MKNFLAKVITFFILLFIITITFNFIYSKIILKNSIINRTQKQFDEIQHIKYLFMGDSHIKQSINAELIENSFNYASFAESYLQTYYKLLYVVKQNKNIEYIILPNDMHSYASYKTFRITNKTFWVDYINFFQLAIETKKIKFISHWFKANFIAYLGDKITIKQSIITFITKKSKPVILGYNPRHSDFSKKTDRDKVLAAKHKVLTHFDDKGPLHETSILYLEKILKLSKEYNIKIILIRNPVSPVYYKYASKYCSIDELDQRINSITKSYDNIIKKLDYLDLYNEKPENFADSDHLNEKGANEYSRLIKQELNLIEAQLSNKKNITLPKKILNE